MRNDFTLNREGNVYRRPPNTHRAYLRSVRCSPSMAPMWRAALERLSGPSCKCELCFCPRCGQSVMP